MRSAKHRLIACCLLALASLNLHAETKLKLQETEITGARELPKVLYIVPWQKAKPNAQPLPMRSLVDEVLAPIDMDEFKRQVRYYQFSQQHQ